MRFRCGCALIEKIAKNRKAIFAAVLRSSFRFAVAVAFAV